VPRIRTIKPELWQDEKLAVLDPSPDWYSWASLAWPMMPGDWWTT
jgi:hypothetical protein